VVDEVATKMIYAAAPVVAAAQWILLCLLWQLPQTLLSWLVAAAVVAAAVFVAAMLAGAAIIDNCSVWHINSVSNYVNS